MSDNRINAALKSAGLALTASLDFADLVASALEALAPIVGNAGSDAKTSTAFTPTFATAGVAMVMTVNKAEYSIIAKRCFVTIYGTLATKGGAGGDAISVILPNALPACKNVSGLLALLEWRSNALTGIASAIVPKAYVGAASRTINLQINSASGSPTTNANLTNANIADGGTDFFISGSYPID